ncbi:MAG: tetratricopeptide repeat protein [Elusimicrobiota bacterium]
MNRRVRAFALAACAFSLSGCIATQKDVLDLSQQSDDLKAQVDDLKKTVTSMQANQADLSVQIKQLREDLTAYTETVKASMGNMDQLSSKLDAMGAQLSGKVTQLGATLSAAQEKGLESQTKALEAQKAELAAQGRETAATELLLTAERRLQARDFAQSASGLEDYLKKYPGGALTDVATYDLGLSYYGLKQWEKAGRQFAVVLDKYPKSGQTPGARLHYALCLVSLKKKGDEARTYLESITADFPKSPEAKEAAAELKRLSSRAAKAAKK